MNRDGITLQDIFRAHKIIASLATKTPQLNFVGYAVLPPSFSRKLISGFLIGSE